jgi:predicted alpha/beta-hydrolase family hydrolase
VLLAAVREAAAGMRQPLLLGGRSMGGRMCSLAAGDADNPLPAAGLVLICYPLHPPGKPDRLRVEHFPRLTVPCLFISGTKDAFGSPDELQRWTATIPCAVSHHWFEGKGHDLKGCDQDIAATVAGWIATTFSAGRGRKGGAARPSA